MTLIGGLVAARTPERLFMLAQRILAVVLGLAPAFYIPLASAPFQLGKTYLLLLAAGAGLILFLLGSLLSRRIAIPRSAVLFLVGALVAAYVIAGFASQNPGLSFAGATLEIDSVLTVVLLGVLTLLGGALFGSRGSVASLAFFGLIGAALVAAVGLVQLTVGVPLPAFASRTANLIGKWNDVGIYFGLLLILASYVLAFYPLSRRLVRTAWAVLVVSFFFVVAVNFFEVWVAILLASLMIVALAAIRARRDGATLFGRGFFARLPLPATILLLLSMVFVSFHSSLAPFVGNAVSVYQIEARPSWGSTLDIAGATYRDNPFLGSGPNTFVEQWLAHKPANINGTPFWEVDFTEGIGVVPTAFTTTGILGGVLWVALLAAFLLQGFSLWRAGRFGSDSLAALLFIAALYLLAMMVFYIPGIALAALGFILLGAFVAHREREAGREGIALQVSLRPASLAGAAASVAVILGSLWVLYGATDKVIAAVYYQKSLQNLAAGDLPQAEIHARHAVAYEESDRNIRLVADVGFALLSKIAASAEGSQQDRLTQFQTVAKAAVDTGIAAIARDQRNYQNWLSIGRLYELMFSLGAADAYGDAKLAYERALALNPHDPSIYLLLARLEATKKDGVAARAAIAKALQEKNNFTLAVFFLSQLEISEGKIADAINSSSAALTLAPDNVALWFQLGFLQYSQRHYAEAAAALERAVAIENDYSNARYFLGLSYQRLKRIPDAVAQFKRIQELNPDSAEVRAILDNLSAGKDPLAGLLPPASTPEKRPDLPIAE